MRNILLAFTALVVGVITLASCVHSKTPSVIGVWEQELEVKGEKAIVRWTFDDDGTCSFYSDFNGQTKNMEDIKWTRSGDSIYIYNSAKEAKGEVDIFRIISLDERALVLWPDGEPKKDIVYLSRKP